MCVGLAVSEGIGRCTGTGPPVHASAKRHVRVGQVGSHSCNELPQTVTAKYRERGGSDRLTRAGDKHATKC